MYLTWIHLTTFVSATLSLSLSARNIWIPRLPLTLRSLRPHTCPNIRRNLQRNFTRPNSTSHSLQKRSVKEERLQQQQQCQTQKPTTLRRTSQIFPNGPQGGISLYPPRRRGFGIHRHVCRTCRRRFDGVDCRGCHGIEMGIETITKQHIGGFGRAGEAVVRVLCR